MTLSDTPVRALVPYVPPAQHKRHPVSAFRALLCELSCRMDALFVRRKRMYLSALLLAGFGMLVGSYFAALRQIQVELLFAVRTAQILLPAVFFTGVTLFGVVLAPVSLLGFSFLFGCAVGQLPLISAQGVLCFGLLLALYLLLLLFSVEAFLTSRRSFSGWKALFACKSFLAFCLLFLFTYLLDRAAEFFLLSLSMIS